ncbi:sigma-70 family RNA polymerase sigma factor [Dokdonia sinensis]|uniref:Sigma-70 family RNA polymerase sigma factor n=1 Tax=Dokdonia sinensis TaxID=2479847 RepID=A0A3M0GEZ4_9FLAO|nr:sigma-70 family RNA polymerase sigma factor [Dokdonia sinensis]RMB63485.1 sigma-70 family RNA polymerase sigma factor [Dokdonia sinensis]
MPKELHDNICQRSVFESIYKKYAQDLTNFLYYKFGANLEPSDRAQDAFIKLWENCAKIPPSKAKSFLFTTANNLMLNAIKHNKVVLNHQKIKPKSYTNEDPEFVLEKKQFARQYEQALSKLSEEQRVAFLLSKVEKKTHQEIADMLGTTKKVVEYRIYSGFKILKEELIAIKHI